MAILAILVKMVNLWPLLRSFLAILVKWPFLALFAIFGAKKVFEQRGSFFGTFIFWGQFWNFFIFDEKFRVSTAHKVCAKICDTFAGKNFAY